MKISESEELKCAGLNYNLDHDKPEIYFKDNKLVFSMSLNKTVNKNPKFCDLDNQELYFTHPKSIIYYQAKDLQLWLTIQNQS